MAIVYVSCAGDHAIHMLELDGAGALRTIDIVSVPAGPGESSSMALALSPDRSRLYAATRAEPYPTSCFEVGPQGRLRWLGSADLPETMAYISVDAGFRHLLGASYHAGVVMCMKLGANGVPVPPAQVIPTPPKAHSIVTDPAGHWIYAACLGGDVVLRFEIEGDQMVQRGSTAVRPGAGPRHMRFGPGGRFLYLTNELDAKLDVFAVADGELSHRQTVPLLPPGTTGAIAAADIHLTPDGTMLFASERLSNTLNGFLVDAVTGLLTPAGSAPSEAGPRGFAIDPSGRFLLCGGQTSNHVGVYAIGSDASLRAIGRHAVGVNPNWLTFLENAS
jgi:6-phosphogluconolactonase